MPKLPDQQQRLYDRLKGRGDVRIEELLKTIEVSPGRHNQQQVLGSYITRLNRRLRNHGQAVKPGEVKRTYRLVVL